MARKGARVVREDGQEQRPDTHVARGGQRVPRREHDEEVWVFSGRVDEGSVARRRAPRTRRAPEARQPGQGRPGRPGPARVRRHEDTELPAEVRAELAEAVGPQRGATLAERMSAAARAYERDRYQDAMRMTKALVEQVPESAAAQELHGLACYRLGRWREAVRHLEAAKSLGGDDPSQLPVLMDCRRALGHHRRVGELWEELRAASPDADLLAEGRVVLASDLADRGDLRNAVSLLTAAGAARNLRHPAERHVRQWYVLADLFERAGDLPRARDLFSRVVDADPELADAGLRLAALGRRSRHRPNSTRGGGATGSRGTGSRGTGSRGTGTRRTGNSASGSRAEPRR